jgi:hypothetical protein
MGPACEHQESWQHNKKNTRDTHPPFVLVQPNQTMNNDWEHQADHTAHGKGAPRVPCALDARRPEFGSLGS